MNENPLPACTPAITVQKDSIGKDILVIFSACLPIVLGIMAISHYWIIPAIVGDKMEARGQFGDQFGSINTILSGLSFLSISIALALQAKSNRLQQTALAEQIEESRAQKAEMQRTAAAQEIANKLSTAQITVDLAKMKLEILSKKPLGTTADEQYVRHGELLNMFSHTEKELGFIENEVRKYNLEG